MSVLNRLSILFLSFFIFIYPASACEPGKSATLEKTLLASDVIIVGKRPDSVHFIPYDENSALPDHTIIEVIETLKGLVNKRHIVVSTSFGMCGSSFLFPDNGLHVLFLKADGEYYDRHEKKYIKTDFQPANDYHGPNSFKIDSEGNIQVDNKIISIDSLVQVVQ